MALALPTLIPAAWASGSGPNKGLINALGTITGGVLAAGPTLSPNASLMDGFPAIDMTNPLAGGVAPSGADFNGALNLVTAFQAWVNAGGKFPFSATLAAAIGGYQIGNVVQLNSGMGEVVSTVANNTQDPNAAMTGWAAWAGPAFAVSQAATAFNATGTAPAFVLTPTPALTALATNDCYNVTFSAAGTTGSNTLNVSGLGAKSLMQYDLNGNLVPAVITSGLVAVCQYNGTYWVVLDALPSSTISSTQQTLVANEGAPGATIPSYKVGVIAASKAHANIALAAAGTNYSLMSAANYIGNLALPANFFVPGKTIKINMHIGISGGVVSSPTLTLYLGGVAMVVIPTTVSNTTYGLAIEAIIECVAVGASGVASFSASACYYGSNNTPYMVGNLVSTGVSTLVANTLDLQIQQASVSSTNVGLIYCTVSVFG